VFYTYVLVNQRTSRLYIGFSSNLKQRVASHQIRDSAWMLAYYEAYVSEADARKRERAPPFLDSRQRRSVLEWRKGGAAWGHLKKRIQESLDLRKAGEALN
jgi:predicted GIY-YIG superfamily endonuclease